MASKSAKKFPVSLRLRDLAKFNPCEGGLEQAKAVLGAEPTLDGAVTKIAAEHGIPVPWIGKALSEGTNQRIAIKLARMCVQNMIRLTSDPVHLRGLEETTTLLRKTVITQEALSSLILNLHTRFRIRTPSRIVLTGYEALRAALAYIGASERRDDQMVKHAIDCVDKLAEVEAFMVTQKVKIPLFDLFVEGAADEKRERILKRKPTAKKSAPKAKATPKAKPRTTVKSASKSKPKKKC